MNQILAKAKRFLSQVRGLLPEAVPTGMTEFNAWANSIASTYALPTKDQDSIRFALASMIMHLGPKAAYRPKIYFVLMFRAAAAKQIAGGVFYEIKQKQTAEATAPKVPVASDGPVTKA